MENLAIYLLNKIFRITLTLFLFNTDLIRTPLAKFWDKDIVANGIFICIYLLRFNIKICDNKAFKLYLNLYIFFKGQERMSSYFNLLKEAGTCAVAKMKIIEWKLSHAGWWVKKQQHDFLPCSCPAHNRTPLDVLK